MLGMNAQPKTPTDSSSATYTAFLLRCWHVAGAWRFTLEDVATRQRKAAIDSHAVVALLKQQLADLAEDSKLE